MPYTDHERFMDIAFLIILIGICILVYIYGEYKYQKGVHDGLKKGRKVRREIRRGNIYRLK